MKEPKISRKWICLIIICLIIISILLFSLFAPLIFTQPAIFDFFGFNFDFSTNTTGNIGNTFAIMNPFIAIAAALITFLAFWAQYEANEKMVKENRAQETTNCFYEMLKIHKENVLELNYTYADNLTENNQQDVHLAECKGRRLFYYYSEEFKCIYQVIDSINKNPESKKGIRNNIATAYNIFYKGINRDSDKPLCNIFIRAAKLVKSESNEQDFIKKIGEFVDKSLRNIFKRAADLLKSEPKEQDDFYNEIGKYVDESFCNIFIRAADLLKSESNEQKIYKKNGESVGESFRNIFIRAADLLKSESNEQKIYKKNGESVGEFFRNIFKRAADLLKSESNEQKIYKKNDESVDEFFRNIFKRAADLLKSESNEQKIYKKIGKFVDESLNVKNQVKKALRELWDSRGFFLKQPPFSGHSQHLNNYYRHLFLTVRLVVEDRNLTYENKGNLLRILRAQLTDDEQLMLFYNWISGYGIRWEATKDHHEKDNKFFSKYRMIHNISPDNMIFIKGENSKERRENFISFLIYFWPEENYPSECWNEKKEKEPDYGPIFEFENRYKDRYGKGMWEEAVKKSQEPAKKSL